MNALKTTVALFATALLGFSLPLQAAPHTYQVTGPVLELTDTSITVQKGQEKWEIARDAGAKVIGDLKIGSKVTIEYSMTATQITVKEGKAPAKK